MLINSYGQPTLLSRENSQLDVEELKESPMILCHKDALIGKFLPKHWKGCLYTSESICNELNNTKYQFPAPESYKKVSLMANETYDVNLGQENIVKLTMVQLADNLMYIIKDQYVKNLVTDNFTIADLYKFSLNKAVREHIIKGIDVLYINDAVYETAPYLNSFPSKFLLRSLAKLVQPMFIKGHIGNTLPQSILNFCAEQYL